MAEAAARDPARGPDRAGPPNGHDHDDTFAELRALLVGPEQRELIALQAHVLDPSVQTRDVSRVLPDAIALRADDPQLTRALGPSVEKAITASVRRDPRPLADALFPVIGPAIRKAIAHTLNSMMESFNRTLEQSVSWRAVQWRWTAFRTGKPFAEIVLLETLQYRVEQVFLIHGESGLLLQHLSSDRQAGPDADQVSAMLTAIRDFARDSFRVAGDDSLEALRIGDLAVLVEQGPHATLAGVVRGTPPHTVRVMLQDAVESIHRQFGPELRAFRGDASPFERARPILESCLVAQFRDAGRRSPKRLWIAGAALVLMVVGAWALMTVRERGRWQSYVDRLRAEPGIVVVSNGRRDGRFVVEGLRDPLARDPAALVAGLGLQADAFESRWEPYEALGPSFVTARARDLLRPPAGVTLTYRDGVLTAAGPAGERWIAETTRIAPAIAGVRRFEYEGPPLEARLQRQLDPVAILFVKGQPLIAPGQEARLDALASLLAEMNQVLLLTGARARVDAIGHTDADGSDVANGPLSEARAQAVLARLRPGTLAAIELSAAGVGSANPAAPGAAEADKARNRRVSFRVRLDPRSERR